MRLRRKPAASGSCLLGLALLAGCTVVRVAEDPVQAPVSGPTGTAIVSLTANTAEVRQFDAITLRRLQDPAHRNPLLEHETVLNNVLRNVSRDTSLFVGALDPGDYEMRELSSSGNLLALPSNTLSAFHVDAGQVTDLGRLVLTSVNEQGMVGRSTTITGNRDFVRRYAPDHLELYRVPPAHGWNEPRKDGDRAEAYARSHPLGTMGFRKLGNGEWVGGTRMGGLLVRGVDGRWRGAVSGDLEAFTAVTPYDSSGNLAVAGGDLGTLVRLTDNGRILSVDRGDLPLGSIFFLDSTADRRNWIVGVQQPGKAVFYTSTALEHGHWTVAASIATELSFWFGAPHVWAWALPDGFGFAATTSAAISCFDYRSGEWQRGQSPGARVLRSIVPAENGAIGVVTEAAPGQHGAFTATHVSADCGRSWKEIAVPSKRVPAAPLRLADGAILELGSDDSGRGIYLTRDDGRSWHKLSDEPVIEERLWAFGPLLLAVSQRHGVEQVRLSKDRGASWTTELSSVDEQRLQGHAAGH